MVKSNRQCPHSVEWFQQMRERNPQHAATAAQLIKLAGNDQCCSICGDTAKVRDYMGDEEIAARLCDHCKRIQESMNGPCS